MRKQSIVLGVKRAGDGRGRIGKGRVVLRKSLWFWYQGRDMKTCHFNLIISIVRKIYLF
jgi:hypothetical protein